ncbi:M56 family metallopeptidase [Cyclobacterium plantarum]|uniref:M56 family metallopeptidase n=1 Tax=Cyclobacterium plantarum TaxID=2716263 RepID=A0ABX0H4E0_9BACT|nr:M56 family metallopeptidase [Cyclobacterium plantarum]NHE56290.1 M56 family metallopeptidase [Cyclobacterium plantarum]
MNPFWNYLFEASIGTALVWLVYILIFRGLTFFGWNRFFLLAGMLISILMPLIEVPLFPNNTLPGRDIIYSFNQLEVAIRDSTTFSSAWNPLLMQVILYAYFGVAALRISVFGIGTISLFQKIRNAKEKKLQEIGIYMHPDFKPASFFNKILMPSFEPDNNLHYQIFLHESAHVRLKHSWDLLALHLIKSIFWINPFVYLIERNVREVHEFQADRKVIQQIAFKDYCQLLVNNLSQSSNSHLINSFNQFQIKNRIVMMNKRRSTNENKWKYFIGIPLLVLVLGLFSLKMTGQEDNVTGTWLGSDFEFTLNEGPDLKELIEGGKNLHVDGKLILNQNNTYQILDPTGTMNGKGKWKLESKNLKLTSQDGHVVAYQIEEISNAKMITSHQVSMETPEGTISGTIRLTYVKR